MLRLKKALCLFLLLVFLFQLMPATASGGSMTMTPRRTICCGGIQTFRIPAALAIPSLTGTAKLKCIYIQMLI